MAVIYTDHVAAMPIHSKVYESMVPYFKEFYGNPSSIHEDGEKAREALEEARGKVARLIGAQDEEIIFMSVHWRAKASLEHYMRSTNGMVLLGAIELLTESAVVRIGNDAPSVGIAALKKMTKKTPYA